MCLIGLQTRRQASSTILELLLSTRRVRKLAIERLAIPEASPQKLGPIRDGWKRIACLRQKAPESGMMPTELVTGTVAVFANSCAQSPDLCNEC
jgi:hypothetical protein